MISNKKIIILISIVLLIATAWVLVPGNKPLGLWNWVGLNQDGSGNQGPARADKADIPVLLHQGWEDYEQGRATRALTEFKRVLALDEDNIEALYGVGLIYKDAQNYRLAEATMEDVTFRAPHYGPAAFTLAQIYRESKQYEQAEKQYLQALEVMPGSANILAELGMVFEAQGRTREAAARYRDALRYVPTLKEADAGLKRLSALDS